MPATKTDSTEIARVLRDAAKFTRNMKYPIHAAAFDSFAQRLETEPKLKFKDIRQDLIKAKDNKYTAIAAMGTNGANHDLSTTDTIQWLRKLETTDSFTPTGIGFDFLQGKFIRKAKNPAALAKRMYQFCPDIVNQGTESIEALEELLRKTRDLYFWWD